MTVLVLADQDNDRLRSGSRNAIAAALQLRQSVDVLVAGSGCAAIAREVATVRGIRQVLVADAPSLADQDPEILADLILSQLRDVTHVLAAATALGRNVLPRVAASLGASQISNIIAIEGPDAFVRPLFDGRAIATVRTSDLVRILTVRTTAFEPAPNGLTHCPIVAIEVPAGAPRTRIVQRERLAPDGPDLTQARVVVAGGRGLGSREQFAALLEPLARQLGGAVGASRAAVDAGYVTVSHQVGSTGKVVAPEVYIAVGISGAVQHLAGMLDSRTIVAINSDPDAPILQIADYALIADAREAIPQLLTALAPHVTAGP